MSLFDDDFYSTRVSRRARWEKDRTSGVRRSGGRSTLRIALTSSLISAAGVALVFGLFTGFNGGSESVKAVAGITNVSMNDPMDKTISAAAKVRPAVVSIINEQAMPTSQSGDGSSGSDAGSADGGGNASGDGSSSKLEEAALGSGFIFEKVKGKAHILTNNHVIADAEAVKAVLSNGETREAKIIGKDEITDLAVLEIDASGIDTVAQFGDSEGLRAGQWVMAIGNPLGLSDSLSMGIVSKTKRVIPVSLSQDGNYDWEQEVIQIDASINQGNSGGPLIDLDGHVVGINSMKIADYGVEGVGFAIPSHAALPIVKSLLEHGSVPRPYLGVYTMDLSRYLEQQSAAAAAASGKGGQGSGDEAGPDGSSDGNGSSNPDAGTGDGADAGSGSGAAPGDGSDDVMAPQGDLKLPADVHDGVIVLQAVGPAAEAGLKYSDVIVKLDNQPISSTMELRKYLYGDKSIGDEIKITYYRGGEKQTTTFKLAEKTED